MAVPMAPQCLPTANARHFRQANLQAHLQGSLGRPKSRFCQPPGRMFPPIARPAMRQDIKGSGRVGDRKPQDNRMQEPSQPGPFFTPRLSNIIYIGLPLLGAFYGLIYHTCGVQSIMSWLKQLFDKVSLGDVIALGSVVVPIGVKFCGWVVGMWRGIALRVSYIDRIASDVEHLNRKLWFLPPFSK